MRVRLQHFNTGFCIFFGQFPTLSCSPPSFSSPNAVRQQKKKSQSLHKQYDRYTLEIIDNIRWTISIVSTTFNSILSSSDSVSIFNYWVNRSRTHQPNSLSKCESQCIVQCTFNETNVKEMCSTSFVSSLCADHTFGVWFRRMMGNAKQIICFELLLCRNWPTPKKNHSDSIISCIGSYNSPGNQVFVCANIVCVPPPLQFHTVNYFVAIALTFVVTGCLVFVFISL